MRSSLLALLALSIATLGAAACSSAPAEEQAEEGAEAVGTKNLMGSSFGLEDHELVLTLDDGPGPRTVELAEWLANEKIPAVFFMVGKNARANPAAVERVVELSKENGGLFLIGNHSMTHSGTPLPRMGVDGAVSEIMDADAILKDAIEAVQQRPAFPNVMPLFRPPYGAFVSLGAANIERINEAGASKYTGPIFWDIGGELTSGYAADWACWGKISVAECTDGYVNESNVRKRGIILAHDVHSKTVDMLTGTGAAGGRSLVNELQSLGFKFVGLRAHDAQVEQFSNLTEQLARSPESTLDATVDTSRAGRVTVDVRVDGGARVKVALDGGKAIKRAPGSIHLEFDVAPGQHVVTVTVLDATGTPLRQERYPFVIAAGISPDSPEAQSPDNCVDFGRVSAGKRLAIYHLKVACDTSGAVQPPGSPSCYRFAGELVASRDPQLVGAREWSLELDLGYASDPRDKSKLGLVIEADSGEIHAGRRFWPGSSKPDVPIAASSVDCAKGQWRGAFHYANGSTEDLLIVASER